jgi:membrane-anchored glycerophosphoryl diester phosphodiesterase (GDPDase)
MSALRIWFDLAQVDVVLSDQRAVRRSIGSAFRHTWKNLGRLLASYVVITIVAAVVLVVGILVWMRFVAPANVVGAVIVSQLTLLLLLIPRFWQRGVAVTYYLQHMVAPIAVQSFAPAPVVLPVVSEPVAAPIIPSAPPEPQAL